MTSTSWSISRRIALRTALIATSLAGAVWLLGDRYLEGSIQRELDTLVREEIEEMRSWSRANEMSEAAAAEVVLEFEGHHPEISMAWRLFEPGAAAPIWELGSTELFLDRPELPATPGTVHVLGRDCRWCTEPLEGMHGIEAGRGPWIGLLLDGSNRLKILSHSRTAALTLLVLTAVLSILGGSLFGLRIGRDLRRVAAGIRSVQRSGRVDPPDVGDVPSEVRDVVDALAETLQRIRGEHDRAKMLVAGLAHELRSPIQNLLGETEVALMRPREPEDYHELLESQIEEFRDLARVVDNLVSLCAATDGEGGRGGEHFDLGEEFAMRLPRERARAERRHVELEVTTSGDLAMDGDREAIFLALSNLIGNAVAWSPPAGRVAIGLRGGPSSIEFTVDDSGPGVPAGEEQRIFEPFYRGSPANGRRVGFGLGLALTRAAIEAHGGAIHVERSPLGGARFRITIPQHGRTSGASTPVRV